MAKGSCACGGYTYEVPENFTATAVCHCVPCRKFAGSNGSTSGVVPKEQYKLLSGEPKTWTRKGDTGMDVTNIYCSTCHNLMAVEADFMPGMKIIKTGTLDDKELLDRLPVIMEVYTRDRPSCFNAFKDVGQRQGQTE